MTPRDVEKLSSIFAIQRTQERNLHDHIIIVFLHKNDNINSAYPYDFPSTFNNSFQTRINLHVHSLCTSSMTFQQLSKSRSLIVLSVGQISGTIVYHTVKWIPNVNQNASGAKPFKQLTYLMKCDMKSIELLAKKLVFTLQTPSHQIKFCFFFLKFQVACIVYSKEGQMMRGEGKCEIRVRKCNSSIRS